LKVSTTATWTYGWDNLNRMVSVKEVTTTGTQLSVSYVYDVLNNRVEDDTWKSSTGTTLTVRHAYDGTNIWADVTTTNTLLARYVYGDGVDQVWARAIPAGLTNSGVAWYLTDREGSVRDIMDSSSVIQDHIDYDGYGNPTHTTISFADREGYAGGQTDLNTGLVQQRGRWYDPKTGRWQSEDPIGFGGGDANLRRYVGNNPTNATDPTGQFLVVKTGAQDTYLKMLADWGIRAGAIDLGTGRVGIVPTPDGQLAARNKLNGGGLDAFDKTVLEALISYNSKNIEGSAGNVLSLANTSLSASEVHTMMQFWAELADGEKYHPNGMENISYLAAAWEGQADGAVIMFDWVTFGLVVSPEQRAALKQEYGWIYYVSGGLGVVAGSALALAAAEAVSGGALSQAIGWRTAGTAGGLAAQVTAMCFPAGTPVHTVAGLKAIEAIESGDRVWAYDHRQLRWTERVVGETFRRQHVGPMATLQLKGETLRATGGHPFWVVRGEGLAERPSPVRISPYEAGGRQTGRWVLAKDLRVGDEVLLRDREVVALETVLLEDVEETVYNFHVTELQNYAVGECGVLVHNTNDILSVGAKFQRAMELLERIELLEQQYAELRALEEADPYTNYFIDDLIEILNQLRTEFQNL
jgi:RHS repeat-associated protein